MTWIAVLLLSIALAMDSFAVSLSAGLAMERVQIRRMGKISLLFAIFQGAMPLIGYAIGFSFESYIKHFDHWVAFVLLSFIGGKMIYESLDNDSDAPAINPYCNKTVATLAFATSIDALAVGMSFSFLNYDIFLPALFIGIITFLFSGLGLTLGVKLGNYFGNKITFVGGIILFGIGLRILIQHLIE